MNKRKKTVTFFLFLGTFLSLVFFSTFGAQAADFDYTPVEPIPGTGIVSDFPGYVTAIYKFAVWSVGIGALLMISIGGFMYFIAAGNASKLESAKKVISDALYGLVIVMVAYLILYIINPDLVTVSLDSLSTKLQLTKEQLTPK